MDQEKNIIGIGSSYDDLLRFPKYARRTAGFQLAKVQNGLLPDDWKPFNTVGAGAEEIRIRGNGNIFRVIYLARFEDAVYVLHCFQKKSQSTRKSDNSIAAIRYRAVLEMRGKH